MDKQSIFSIWTWVNEDSVGYYKNTKILSKNFDLNVKNFVQYVAFQILWTFIRCLYQQENTICYVSWNIFLTGHS